jgi:hypothetical protein
MLACLRSRTGRWIVVLLCLLTFGVGQVSATEEAPHVYVILWFDTEDYLLTASDDAALRLAQLLRRLGIRGVFKIVGERARTLQRRGRSDVIEALKWHEIGYHSNYHSTQPTPAMYLSDLGWDEGVAEFSRREKPGFDDVQRIFGTTPTCYGQPGSSWGPQSYGALKDWGVRVYLDAGSHVDLDGKPCYYGGLLTLYHLEHILRADLSRREALRQAEDRFLAARKKLLAEGGGLVSIFYHPCEFVHRQFWDGVNFSRGANPPREQWKAPPMKTRKEIALAFEIFETYVRFIQRFPEVRFLTATEALKLYHDKAQGRTFKPAELKAIAAQVGEGVTFQQHGDYALAASEVLLLLNEYVAQRGSGRSPAGITLHGTPYGPSGVGPVLEKSLTTDGNQFQRTAADVADFLRKQGRVPTSVWLGSVRVPPEAYLRALAEVTVGLVDGKPMPATVEIKPARLAAAEHVSKDRPGLWGWVIFPPGFRAPAMMELARRQAWTLKPAILDRTIR